MREPGPYAIGGALVMIIVVVVLLRLLGFF